MYATLFQHVLLPAYETLVGRGTHRYLEEYSRSQWLDGEGVARVQLDKLNTCLLYTSDAADE